MSFEPEKIRLNVIAALEAFKDLARNSQGKLQKHSVDAGKKKSASIWGDYIEAAKLNVHGHTGIKIKRDQYAGEAGIADRNGIMNEAIKLQTLFEPPQELIGTSASVPNIDIFD